MERHKKHYQSKWQNQYTEEFKRQVCNDFLTGNKVWVEKMVKE